jgi:hypothetical protein
MEFEKYPMVKISETARIESVIIAKGNSELQSLLVIFKKN